MTRLNFTLSIKKQRLTYATGEDGLVHCEYCGVVLKRGQWEFHHHLADWLGGKPTFENCRVIGNICCHPAETSKDKTLSAKSDRVQAANLGTKAAPIRPIQNRGFSKSEKQAKREAGAKDKLPIPQRREGYIGCFKIVDEP